MKRTLTGIASVGILALTVGTETANAASLKRSAWRLLKRQSGQPRLRSDRASHRAKAISGLSRGFSRLGPTGTASLGERTFPRDAEASPVSLTDVQISLPNRR